MNRAYGNAICFVLLVACGGDAGSASLVGATCKLSSECDVTGICLTDGKDGACSLTCEEPGAAQECPLGSYCDSGKFTTDKTPTSDMTVCLPACKEQSDCRDGYTCKGVSGGPGKVCAPK
jgi:hypothetical protein